MPNTLCILKKSVLPRLYHLQLLFKTMEWADNIDLTVYFFIASSEGILMLSDEGNQGNLWR